MKPKKSKPQPAVCSLSASYPYSSTVEHPLAGHVFGIYLVNGCNSRQTARDLLAKFPCELTVSVLVGRLAKLLKDLETTNFARDQGRIKTVMDTPFDLSNSKTPGRTLKRCLQEAPLNVPSSPVPTPPAPEQSPPLKILKTDCDKCPVLRKDREECLRKVKEVERCKMKELAAIKVSYSVKSVNRSKRLAEATKKKLRKDICELRKDNARLTKEFSKLQDLVDSFTSLKANLKKRLNRTRTSKSVLIDEIKQLKKTIYRLKKELRDVLMDRDDLNCSFSEKTVEDRICTRKGKEFVPDVRKCLFKCLDCQVPVDKASELIRFISFHLCQKVVKPLPSPATTAQAAFDLGVISDLQVAEALYNAETATLGWDATSLGGSHFNEVHVATKDETKNVKELTLQVKIIKNLQRMFPITGKIIFPIKYI